MPPAPSPAPLGRTPRPCHPGGHRRTHGFQGAEAQGRHTRGSAPHAPARRPRTLRLLRRPSAPRARPALRRRAGNPRPAHRPRAVGGRCCRTDGRHSHGSLEAGHCRACHRTAAGRRPAVVHQSFAAAVRLPRPQPWSSTRGGCRAAARTGHPAGDRARPFSSCPPSTFRRVINSLYCVARLRARARRFGGKHVSLNNNTATAAFKEADSE